MLAAEYVRYKKNNNKNFASVDEALFVVMSPFSQ